MSPTCPGFPYFPGAWQPCFVHNYFVPNHSCVESVLPHQVEQERGITVKAQTASLRFTYNDNEYLLNLIDTPGHVDFSNEVSRSLAVCQGE